MAAQSEYERVLLAWTNGSAFFSLDINARESYLGWKGDPLSRGNFYPNKRSLKYKKIQYNEYGWAQYRRNLFFSKRHVPGKKSQ